MGRLAEAPLLGSGPPFCTGFGLPLCSRAGCLFGVPSQLSNLLRTSLFIQSDLRLFRFCVERQQDFLPNSVQFPRPFSGRTSYYHMKRKSKKADRFLGRFPVPRFREILHEVRRISVVISWQRSKPKLNSKTFDSKDKKAASM